MRHPIPKELLAKLDPLRRVKFVARAEVMTEETFNWFLAAAWARLAVGLEPRIGKDSVDYYKLIVRDPVNCESYNSLLYG